MSCVEIYGLRMRIAPKILGEEKSNINSYFKQSRNNDIVVGVESKSAQRLRVQLSTGVYTL